MEHMPHDFHMSQVATTSSRPKTSSPEPAPRSERLGPHLQCLQWWSPQCPERPGRRWAQCAQCKGHWRGHPLEDPPAVATYSTYSTYINIPQKCRCDASTMFTLFNSFYIFLCLFWCLNIDMFGMDFSCPWVISGSLASFRCALQYSTVDFEKTKGGMVVPPYRLQVSIHTIQTDCFHLPKLSVLTQPPWPLVASLSLKWGWNSRRPNETRIVSGLHGCRFNSCPCP